MSLLKIASVACIALTLGACQSLFEPSYKAPLETLRDTAETIKPGCTGAECRLLPSPCTNTTTDVAPSGTASEHESAVGPNWSSTIGYILLSSLGKAYSAALGLTMLTPGMSLSSL